MIVNAIYLKVAFLGYQSDSIKTFLTFITMVKDNIRANRYQDEVELGKLDQIIFSRLNSITPIILRRKS